MPSVLASKPDCFTRSAADDYSDLPSTELVRLWRSGDQRAATELFDRYFSQLLAMVNGRVNRRFNSRMSNDEIVQSAFGSVFRMTRDRPQEFANDEAFRRWLVTVVLNKMFKRIQRESAQKCDPAREQAINSSEGFAVFVAEQLCKSPDIEGVLEMAELIDKVSTALPNHLQSLICLRLQDLNQTEAAKELGVSTRTVRRWSEEIDRRAQAILMKELQD